MNDRCIEIDGDKVFVYTYKDEDYKDYTKRTPFFRLIANSNNYYVIKDNDDERSYYTDKDELIDLYYGVDVYKQNDIFYDYDEPSTIDEENTAPKIYQKNAMYGYIKYDGTKLSEACYAKADRFYFGCARVTDNNGNTFFIDEDNNRMSVPQSKDYSLKRKLSDKTFLAVSTDGNKCPMLINSESGEVLRKFTYDDELSEFENGIGYYYNHKEQKCYIISDEGKTLVDLWKYSLIKLTNINKRKKGNKATQEFYKLKEKYDVVLSKPMKDETFTQTVCDKWGKEFYILCDNKGKVIYAIRDAEILAGYKNIKENTY